MDIIIDSITQNIGGYYTLVTRWVLAFLGVFILFKCIKSLLQAKSPAEIWAYLSFPDGTTKALTHWENVIGRAKSADVVVDLASISRNHGTIIRDTDGHWEYNDLGSKNGSFINGVPVKAPTRLEIGDTITMGGAEFTLMPVSIQERQQNIKNRIRKTRPVSPWTIIITITIFQVLTSIQIYVARKDDYDIMTGICMAILCAAMWAYVIIMRGMKRRGFEMELIAFFLSSLSLAITSVAKFSGPVLTQLIAILLGVAAFFVLCWFLRDLGRAKKARTIFAVLGVLLLLINVVFSSTVNGSSNWVYIAGFSFQPSEFVKIILIFVGAGTLDELYEKKNLTMFMIFSALCMLVMAYIRDFGTASIFFVTFLIISFLRSGDFSKLILIGGAAVFGLMLLLRVKPHVISRFETWHHIWEKPFDEGMQQVQNLISVANGGLLGNGAGEGHLSQIYASQTDLVFGFLSEEFGLLIAVLAVASIITLAIFAFISIQAGRSAFYTIAACSATSLFLFQTALNVLGSLDILPFTGVPFPFVSSGGTSMLSSWGLLAFLKAADTRQDASFALRLGDREVLAGSEVY